MSAAAGLRKRFEVLLIDRQAECNFLPLLPDAIGRDINPQALTYRIGTLAQDQGFSFLNAQVISVDVEKCTVTTSEDIFACDYLIIASGCETNFYNNDIYRRSAFVLDNAQDAKKIDEAIASGLYDTFIIAGGGYTGIETATNLKTYFNKRHLNNKKVMIIERAAAILGPLPEWMKVYVKENLRTMDIEVVCNTTITRIEGDGVTLSNAKTFTKTMLIWTAGVKTSDFIQNLNAQRNAQGRITVDEYLRLNPRVFVAGDAAYVSHKDSFLRMAVQFAITEGSHVALNIVRSARGKRLKKFKAVDFGYIIPMANNRSCGRVLGINMKGYIPTLMHYCMCIFRSYGWRNRCAIVRDLLWGRK